MEPQNNAMQTARLPVTRVTASVIEGKEEEKTEVKRGRRQRRLSNAIKARTTPSRGFPPAQEKLSEGKQKKR